MLGDNITIIGGSGGMGQIFAKIFKKNGFQVTLTARNRKKLENVSQDLDVKYDTNLERSLKNADIVMISVPISSTIQVIKRCLAHMKKGSLLFDITSLKSKVFPVLDKARKNYSINCLTIHPMFGPGINSLKDYNMISLKIGGLEDYDLLIDRFLNIFKNEGLKVIELQDPQYHDKMMGFVLGAPHMFNILFLNLLKNSDIELSEFMKFTGTTFLLQTVFAESIIQREEEMFGEIQMLNQEFHTIIDNFERIVQNYKSIIKNKKINLFKTLFMNGKQYSKQEQHFDRSYDYFYQFLEILKNKNKNRKT